MAAETARPYYLVIFTEPGDDRMREAHFFNRADLDSWLDANQQRRAIVVTGSNIETEDHQ